MARCNECPAPATVRCTDCNTLCCVVHHRNETSEYISDTCAHSVHKIVCMACTSEAKAERESQHYAARQEQSKKNWTRAFDKAKDIPVVWQISEAVRPYVFVLENYFVEVDAVSQVVASVAFSFVFWKLLLNFLLVLLAFCHNPATLMAKDLLLRFDFFLCVPFRLFGNAVSSLSPLLF